MTTNYYARIDYTYSGGTKIFSVPFDYIEEEHLNVFINNNICTLWTNINTSQIQIDDSVDLTAGDTVTIIRNTPLDERMVVFSDTSILNKDNQNLAHEQVFDVVQEVHDSLNSHKQDVEDLKPYIKNAVENIESIKTVSENQTSINTVADDIANVDIVASNASSINSVASNIVPINNVSESVLDVNEVASYINDIHTVSNNIDAVYDFAVQKDMVNQSKGLVTGNISCDADVFETVKSYAHSTFDLSKFTVTGTPTITDDGVASGFSLNNYFETPLIDLSKPFKMEFVYTTGSTVDDVLLSFGTNARNYIWFRPDRTQFSFDELSITATSWTVLQINTKYRIIFAWDGTTYNAEVYSMDGTLYTSVSKESSTALSNSALNIGKSEWVGANSSAHGSIDLKQFSITVDGVSVFSGNKTGIDTIKADDYTVVGTPVISADGIASGFGQSDYLTIPFVGESFQKPFKATGKFKTNSSTMSGTIFGLMGSSVYDWNRLLISSQKLSFAINVSSSSSTKIISSTNDLSASTDYEYECGQLSNGTMYLKYRVVGSDNWLEEVTDTSPIINIDSITVFRIGQAPHNTSEAFTGSIDLNSFKIYTNGNLVYQPCLKIPYTQSKTGSKIVDSIYCDRVSDMYAQFGYAPYYALQENKKGNYTVVGSPTISSDFIASGFSNSNYLATSTLSNKNFKLQLPVNFGSNPFNSNIYFFFVLDTNNAEFYTLRCNSGAIQLTYKTTSNTNNYWTIAESSFISANTNYLLEIETSGSNISTKVTNTDNNTSVTNSVSNFNPAAYGSIGLIQIGRQFTYGSIDLNAFKIYVDGKLAYEAVTGPNFTLPMGELYGMIEKSKNNGVIGQTIFSLDPLYNDNLHLLDGSLLYGNGVYKEFIENYIKPLYSKQPSRFTTESAWQTSINTYGVCGYYVYDSINNTVRLPKVTGFVEGTLTASALGQLTQAGLPNITGSFTVLGDDGNTYPHYSSSGTGAFSLTKQTISGATFENTGTGSDSRVTSINFRASGSSGIYGNSSTVQPQSIKGYMYIVVANGETGYVPTNTSGIITDLNNKTDKSAVDGQWVYKNAQLANEVTWTTNTAEATYSLSSYLPDDNYNYEVLFTGAAVTGTTSNNFVTVGITTDIITTHIPLCEARTRTTSTIEAQGNGILPVGQGRYVKQYSSSSSNANGTYSLYAKAYRRIGTNT